MKLIKHASTKVLLLNLLLIPFSSHTQTIQIEKSSIIAPDSLGQLTILHDEDGFKVIRENKENCVENCWVDPILRDISNEKLQNFLETGKIVVSQMDNEELSLKAQLSYKGSGPILATWGYWTTKVTCYLSVGVVSTATAPVGAVANAAILASGAGMATGIEALSAYTAAFLFWLPTP